MRSRPSPLARVLQTEIGGIIVVTFEGEIMDYYQSAHDMEISRARALREIYNHGAVDDLEEFYAEYGVHDNYMAQDVLDWLGY